MDALPDPIDLDVASALFSVASGSRAASDAWVDLIRLRHPAAAEHLARLAMTEIALGLLVANGDMSDAEAARQRRSATEAVHSRIPSHVWRSVYRLKRQLEVVEASMARERDADRAVIGGRGGALEAI